MAAQTGNENGKQGGLARFLLIVAWLPNYDRAWLKSDIIAGLSVWALMWSSCCKIRPWKATR